MAQRENSEPVSPADPRKRPSPSPTSGSNSDLDNSTDNFHNLYAASPFRRASPVTTVKGPERQRRHNAQGSGSGGGGTLPLPNRHSPAAAPEASGLSASTSLRNLSSGSHGQATALDEPVFMEVEAEKGGAGEEVARRAKNATLPMQARTIRLSAGTASDVVKDNRLSLATSTNCVEKIVFCIDVSSEMSSTHFTSKTGDKENMATLVRKVLKMFLNMKQSIGAKHEYALMFLNHKAYWVHDFQSDASSISTKFDALSGFHDCDTCDLSTIFDEIRSRAPLFDAAGCRTFLAPYTVRVILIYGRSHCVPQLVPSAVQTALQASPYFFLDVLYLHKPVAPDNQCEKIFDVLCNLDSHSTAYILEASKNPTKVYDGMAQLIGHPLQRTLQKDVNFVLP